MLKWRSPFAEETAVALNVGGAMIPLCFSAYALSQDAPGPLQLFLASILVAGIAELARHAVLRGAMILPFVLVAPLSALLLGWILGAEHRATLTYVSGLIGRP